MRVPTALLLHEISALLELSFAQRIAREDVYGDVRPRPLALKNNGLDLEQHLSLICHLSSWKRGRCFKIPLRLDCSRRIFSK